MNPDPALEPTTDANEEPLTPPEVETPEPTTPDTLTEPAAGKDTIVIRRAWLVTAAVGLVMLALGVGVGYVLALTAYTRGEANTVAEVEDAVDSAVDAAVADSLGTAMAQQPAAIAAAEQQPTATPLPARLDNVSVDDDPAMGPADAPITIVEFSDFRCPYCGRFQLETLPALLEAYPDQIRFVYRDFPVVGGELAAVAAECADNQGEFWPYHDALFADQQAYSSIEDYAALAEDLGLDSDEFSTCLDAEETLEEIVNDYNDGREYGISGTPTFFVNGVRVVGAQPLDAFQMVIDQELDES